jgi:hypothetical protein
MGAMEEIHAHDQDEEDESDDEDDESIVDPPTEPEVPEEGGKGSKKKDPKAPSTGAGSQKSGPGKKKKQTRGRVTLQLAIAGGRITGVMAKIAQEARIRFGNIGMTAYNKNAVRRWVVAEASKVNGLRTRDLMNALPLIELYVFYRTDDDVELEEAITELIAMGRVRMNAP